MSHCWHAFFRKEKKHNEYSKFQEVWSLPMCKQCNEALRRTCLVAKKENKAKVESESNWSQCFFPVLPFFIILCVCLWIAFMSITHMWLGGTVHTRACLWRPEDSLKCQPSACTVSKAGSHRCVHQASLFTLSWDPPFAVFPPSHRSHSEITDTGDHIQLDSSPRSDRATALSTEPSP